MRTYFSITTKKELLLEQSTSNGKITHSEHWNLCALPSILFNLDLFKNVQLVSATLGCKNRDSKQLSKKKCGT